MKYIDAYNYLNYAVKEGYIDEDYAKELMNLDYKEFIKEVGGLMDRADNYYDQLKDEGFI